MKKQTGLQQEVLEDHPFSFIFFTHLHIIIVNNTPPSPISRNTSSDIETTTQQAGRLFSNFSSFLTRKSKEFSQVMEVTLGWSQTTHIN